jgi:hypothetical protein
MLDLALLFGSNASSDYFFSLLCLRLGKAAAACPPGVSWNAISFQGG